jgi:hypothetical protein
MAEEQLSPLAWRNRCELFLYGALKNTTSPTTAVNRFVKDLERYDTLGYIRPDYDLNDKWWDRKWRGYVF